MIMENILNKLEKVRVSFVVRMENELVHNAENKGDWLEWKPDFQLLNSELLHHYTKLIGAVAAGDRAKVSEYSADVANYAMKFDEIFGDTVIPELQATVIGDSAEQKVETVPTEEAARRFQVIRHLVESPARTREMIDTAANGEKVHPTTIYRWLRLYEDTGQISALDPKVPDGGRGRSRLKNEVDLIIADAVSKLRKEKNSVNLIIEEVTRCCAEKNLKAPHNNSIRNRIDVLTGRQKRTRRKRRFAVSSAAAEVKQ